MGRSDFSGGSQAVAKMRASCSAVNLPGETWTRGVSQDRADGFAQRSDAVEAFDKDEAIEGVSPAGSPDADLMAFEADLGCNVLVEHAGEGKQDDGGALAEEGRLTTRAAELVEDFLLLLGDDDLGRVTWHGCSLAPGCELAQPR